MSYTHRIPSAIRAFSRACAAAIASLVAAISAYGAALPPGL